MYQQGFGNHFSTEALKGALPQHQNTPQKVAYGLYAEQISGTAFTAFRSENLRTWVYRIRPSVILASEYEKKENGLLVGFPSEGNTPSASPNPLRWSPLPEPSSSTDFISGLITMVTAGHCGRGGAIHHYFISEAAPQKFFYNADGEMLYVPEKGDLTFRTELGVLNVKPGEIAVIPRGLKFQITTTGKAKGYICENFGLPFRLPYLGPIGANGLANARDFQYPIASYEEKEGKFELWTKFQGQLWSAPLSHSPLDVVAWHGNYAPYKYDLSLFQTVSPVSFDHPDPSIFTVLTSPSEIPGTANFDFVIFPPRWLVMEHSFRPPYFHRNIMSEYMGLIRGVYEAKQTGFLPGGASLHNSFSAHGPDFTTFEKASNADLKPEYLADALAFMFESSLPYRPTAYAMKTPSLQKDYLNCWKDLKKNFDKKA